MTMAALAQIRMFVRDRLPASWAVPIKYRYLQARGRLEPELVLLPMLIAKGERALDVGANYGTYALTLARLGARVDLFEPNPAIAKVLAAWTGRKEGLQVYALALSDVVGTAELVIPRDEEGTEHDSSASIAPNFSSSGRRIAVPTAPLDSLAISDAALIKIDVEGHETAVLNGARQTIAASRPALIVEIEQRHLAVPIDDVLQGLMALDYAGWFLCGGTLLPLARFDLAQHQNPQLFEKRSGIYCNNFIFLANERVARGDYAALVRRASA